MMNLESMYQLTSIIWNIVRIAIVIITAWKGGNLRSSLRQSYAVEGSSMTKEESPGIPEQRPEPSIEIEQRSIDSACPHTEGIRCCKKNEGKHAESETNLLPKIDLVLQEI